MLFTKCDDIPQSMKLELEAAATFIVNAVRKARKGGAALEESDYEKFQSVFMAEVSQLYKQHWYPDNPVKGSGYRCIRNNGKLDPLLNKIASKVGIASSELHALLPHEFTMWIDPLEVCCRFGEEGSVNILYQDKRSKSPITPPSKKIRETVDPPATPVKTSQSQHILQVTPPPQKQHRIISPSNSTRRASPSHFNLLHPQFHPMSFFKENCKDLLRPSHVMSFSEGLYVSS